MKRKFLLALCVLLTAVLLVGVLAGCNATPKRVAGSGNAEVYPTVVTTVAEIDGANVIAFNDELVVMTKQDGTTGAALTGVYNFAEGALIVPFDAQTVSLDSGSRTNVFSVADADTGKLTYYDRKGNVLAQNVTPGTPYSEGVNFVEIGDNIYNVSDGELKYQIVKGFGYDADILLDNGIFTKPAEQFAQDLLPPRRFGALGLVVFVAQLHRAYVRRKDLGVGVVVQLPRLHLFQFRHCLLLMLWFDDYLARGS